MALAKRKTVLKEAEVDVVEVNRENLGKMWFDLERFPLFELEYRCLHPELQATGPASYRLDQVDEWWHPRQHGPSTDPDNDRPTAQEVLERLEEDAMLGYCLGMADAVALQKFGLNPFRKRFMSSWDGPLFLFRSVFVIKRKGKFVPYVFNDGNIVGIGYLNLDDCVYGNPALRFAPPT